MSTNISFLSATEIKISDLRVQRYLGGFIVTQDIYVFASGNDGYLNVAIHLHESNPAFDGAIVKFLDAEKAASSGIEGSAA